MRIANSAASTRSLMVNATRPPISAPVAVNSSRSIPSRRLAIRPWRYVPAAALDVTMTQTSETATASRSGRPKPIVRSGTMRIPPPSPSSAPNRPAAAPPASIRSPAVTADRTPCQPPASAAPRSGTEGLWGVRQQRDVPGPLQRDRQLALVAGARAGLPTRLDLRSLGEVAAEAVDLLVVDDDRLVRAERADLSAPSVAVVVVSLLRLGSGHELFSWVRTGGRRGRRRPAVGHRHRRGRRQNRPTAP